MRHLASLLVLVLPFVVAAQNLSFPLHHRFIPSLYADTADTRWFHRGTVFIDLDSGAGRFEEASGTGGAVVLLGDEGEWYQVGLETGGDGIGPMSSTRAVSDDICSGLPGRLQSEYPNCLSVTASGLLLLLLVPVLVVVLVPVPVLAILSTMWLCRFPIAFALGL
jgi:hypothetical protein